MNHLVFERKQGGKMVAFLELMQGVDEAEILNIETLPKYRRQGLAASLLAEALAWAIQNQRQAIWLEVRRSNEGALALYAKMGFIRISTRAKYYADGEDALVMKCSV